MMVLLRAPALFPTSSPYILQLPSELESDVCNGQQRKRIKRTSSGCTEKRGTDLNVLFSKSNKLTGRWGPRSHIFLPWLSSNKWWSTFPWRPTRWIDCCKRAKGDEPRLLRLRCIVKRCGAGSDNLLPFLCVERSRTMPSHFGMTPPVLWTTS